MKDGDFFSKIKRLLLNVTKLHRHVFENPGFILPSPFHGRMHDARAETAV